MSSRVTRRMERSQARLSVMVGTWMARHQDVKLSSCQIVKLSGAGSVTTDELGTNKFSPCCQDSKDVEEVFLDPLFLPGSGCLPRPQPPKTSTALPRSPQVSVMSGKENYWHCSRFVII